MFCGRSPAGLWRRSSGGEGARAGSNKKLSGVHAMSRTLFASRSKSFAVVPNAHESEGAGKAPKQAGALSSAAKAEERRQKRLVRSQADVMGG